MKLMVCRPRTLKGALYDAYFLTRFWNASLSMMPMTSDENRLSFAAARRTIPRTIGMSYACTGRPSAYVYSFSAAVVMNASDRLNTACRRSAGPLTGVPSAN